MKTEFKIDMKLGIMIFLNMAPPRKLVLAPGAIFIRNTVFVWMSVPKTENPRHIDSPLRRVA